MKTIYNTYIVMESQKQCGRMRQFCIDKELPVWEEDSAFDFSDNTEESSVFTYLDYYKEFFVIYLHNSKCPINRKKVREEEFKKLI